MDAAGRTTRVVRAAIAVALIAVTLRATGSVAADDPVEIAAVLPLSGSAAVLGAEARDALATIEAYVNDDGGIDGRPIHVAIADDESNARTAVQLTAALVAKHVPLILGSAVREQCDAMAPLVTHGPVLYCLAPDFPPVDGSFAFASGFSTSDDLLVALRYLRLRKLLRIATIASNDAAGRSAEAALAQTLALRENAGMSVVAREHFDRAEPSAVAQMTRIKASGAQVTIAWNGGATLGTLLRSANAAALAMPVLTSSINLTYEHMRQYASILPAELLFPAGPSYAPDEIGDKATRAAVAFYLAQFNVRGIRPDIGQSLAWDPALLAVTALRALGPHATAEQLRADLAHRRNWIGSNGSYDFARVPQRGLGPSGIVIVRWDAVNTTWDGVSAPGGRPLEAAATPPP